MKFYLQILICIFWGLAFKVEAQNYVTVYDAESLEPLAYANVKLTELVSNKSNQTISNDKGVIEIPYENETLVFMKCV